MRPSQKNIKDLTAGGSPAYRQEPAPRRTPASSDTRGGKGRILRFPKQCNGSGPQGPEPSPFIGCSPVRYRIEDFRANIVAAARQGRHYRSIAAQYGLNALEVWQIVTDALAAEKWRNGRAA